jgi:uncharacterized membrane protein
MRAKAAITVLRSRDELQRLWEQHRPGYVEGAGAAVAFVDAPGDRGTEIHVDLEHRMPGGRLGDVIAALIGSAALPKVKDDLRRFKQYVETGEIPRSDATPEGESAERKLKQRPAQPLAESELARVGAR